MSGGRLVGSLGARGDPAPLQAAAAAGRALCGNDQIARGAVDALRDLGRSVPAEVAVVGFDNWEVMAKGARRR